MYVSDLERWFENDLYVSGEIRGNFIPKKVVSQWLVFSEHVSNPVKNSIGTGNMLL